MSETKSIDLAGMHQAAERACALMRVLANENRLLLMCQLSLRELCVSELESLLDIHQPTLSQQLTVLRNEGLVSTRREGKNIYYRIESAEALALMHTLYQQFCPIEEEVSHES